MGKRSSTLFGLALLLFFLPWVTVSCGNSGLLTFSGTDLVIGKTLETPQFFGASKKETIREARAILAFIIGLAGVLAGFLIKKERVKKVVLNSCGAAGGILLFLMKHKLDNEALTQTVGVISVDYHFGFYASMLLFFAVPIVNLLPATGLLKKTSLKPIQSTSLTSSPQIAYCSHCGAKVSPDDMFCGECGHSLK